MAEWIIKGYTLDMPEENSPKRSIKPVVEEVVTDPTPVPQTPVVPVNPPPEPINMPSPAQVPPPGVMLPKKVFRINLGFMLVVIIVAVIVALVSGALYVYFNGVKGFNPEPQITPQPTVVTQPTPVATLQPQATTEPEVDLSTLKVSILNGSGKPGEAGNAKKLLENAGFKITSTGNADNFSFKTTLIQAKSTVAANIVGKVKTALSDSYEVEVGDPLNSKSSFDIIVTVGAE